MLPYLQSDDQTLNLLQTKWRAELNPLLALPLISGLQLTAVLLSIGSTVINHKLGRTLQGWILTDQNASAKIYRSRPLNDTTLTLTSDAAVTVSIWVY